MLQDCTNSNTDITHKQLLDAITSGIAGLNTKIDESDKRILIQLSTLNTKIDDIETEQKVLQQKIEILDIKSRKNNIIVYGLNINNAERRELIDLIISKFNEHMQLDIVAQDISDIYLLGRSNKSPIKIEFVRFLTKLTILQNAHKLSGTDLSISKDRTVAEQNERKILVKQLKIAKANGSSARIKNRTLVIDDVTYSVDYFVNASDIEDSSDNGMENESSDQTLKRKKNSPLASENKREPKKQKNNKTSTYSTRSKLIPSQ